LSSVKNQIFLFLLGVVKCTLPVTECLGNSWATLHGGATCTIIDIVGTMALLTLDHERAGVTVDLNASYTNAARVGDTLMIEGRVLKTGKTLGFTEVTINRKSDGKLVAKGRHTKVL